MRKKNKKLQDQGSFCGKGSADLLQKEASLCWINSICSFNHQDVGAMCDMTKPIHEENQHFFCLDAQNTYSTSLGS